jgi:hypothetical protein
MAGVNDELRPLVRMTAPRDGTIADLPLGKTGFRSVGSTVTDRLRIEPRLPGASWLVRRMATATFRHRHRRLVRRFGPPPAS